MLFNHFLSGAMPTKAVILSHMEQIAREQKVKLPPLLESTALLDTGMDSLCFAILVARLEDALGFDPFTASEEAYFPATIGEFIRVYENAARAREVPA
jgi:acyl carrier protein